MGTLAYMSPEQAPGGGVDERSDVFSLGVLLYELLDGRRPFEGENAVELVDAILREPPPPLARGASGRRAGARRPPLLEKEGRRRHPDMAAVCGDLTALLAGRSPGVRARHLRCAGSPS
jgi:serine/threonine-protein kinase